MSNKITTISLSELLKNEGRVSKKVVAQTNQRIKEVMKDTVRDFQKKQKTSFKSGLKIKLKKSTY